MKRVVFLLAAIFALATAASAQGTNVGATLDNFSMPDVNGMVHSLNDMKGKNGTVLMFVSSQCPVVKGYNDRMNQIATDYAAKGITFIGINANSTEMDAMARPADWVKSHIAATYKFPVLFDKGNVVADKLGATTTPEAYFIDAKNTLLYHGAIDNDRSGSNVTERYLTTAFDLTLAGKPVARKSANAFGCTIKKVGM
jgi:thiol-disulfide isomerase/thioredoxin